MKCAYHPEAESQELCSACNKFLCAECAHKIKGKAYCQDCLIEGAEWAATFKGLKLPSDAPRRAALCAIIPGLGAVYNNEYLKAVTYFSVWTALAIMGSRIHGVFVFASIVFVLYTMFDAYRSAEATLRKRIQSPAETSRHDRTIIGWGIFLIILGIFFLLDNIIPYDYVNKLWPLVFILLGGYLVYYAVKKKTSRIGVAPSVVAEHKEEI
jgi:hypothetical protein